MYYTFFSYLYIDITLKILFIQYNKFCIYFWWRDLILYIMIHLYLTSQSTRIIHVFNIFLHLVHIEYYNKYKASN